MPCAAARAQMSVQLSRARAGSIARPTAVAFTETFASRPLEAIASMTLQVLVPRRLRLFLAGHALPEDVERRHRAFRGERAHGGESVVERLARHVPRGHALHERARNERQRADDEAVEERRHALSGVRARTRARTSAAPAAHSASAAAKSVAPVVTTSSTRTRTRPRARGDAANAPLTFARRPDAGSEDCGGVSRVRERSARCGVSRWRLVSSARSMAGSYPRSRLRRRGGRHAHERVGSVRDSGGERESGKAPRREAPRGGPSRRT